MDREAMEFIFQSNFNTVKEFIKLMIDPLKSEIHQLKSDNEELKKSLEYTQAELCDIKSTIREQDRQGDNLAVGREFSERVRNLEDYSRKNNLIIDGLDEKKEENNEMLQVMVERLFRDNLEMTPDIDIIHRLGKTNNGRPRAVIVKLKTFSERQECLRKAPKLKGTNIFINEDVCKATMEIRKTKLKELKEKREQGFIAYFSGADLITKERGIKQTEARRSGYSNRVNDNKREENNSHNSDSAVIGASNKKMVKASGPKLRSKK